MKTKLPTFKSTGFSLVEMLVVIAVIGIIAAIAVPSIGRINEAATQSKNQRNAQSAASVVSAAKAAGYDFVATAVDPTSQHWVLHNVTNGATINEAGNPFDGTYFAIPSLSEEDFYGAQGYLAVVGGELQYIPDGGSIDPVEPAP